MKKNIILLLAVLLLAGVASAETKLSMELWNRWTYKMVDGADEASKNELAFKRGYLRLEPVLSSKIKGRFNLDFFSDDGADDGVGIKLKYAYLDFSGYLWKDAKFTVGLMKNYFGTIYTWAYETIDKDPADKYKFASSTDYGFGISGYLPQGYGEYNVAIYNGEGYKKTGGDIDTNMAYLGNIRLIPMVGLMVGGTVAIDTKYDADLDEDETITKIAALGQFTMIPGVDVRAQYLTRTHSIDVEGEDDLTVSAISVMPMIDFHEWTPVDMELVLRYDMYDDDADVDNDAAGSGAYDTMIGGVNYYVLRDAKNKPKMWLQANYQMKDYKDEAKDDESELMVQMRWKFSENIK